MNIIFISNYFNHHQKPLSDALYDRLKDYYFIETEPMEDERISLGWGMKSYPPYVIRSHQFFSNKSKFQELIDTADVVIIGSAPTDLVKRRIANYKLTFRYSERLLKKGSELWKYPFRLLRLRKNNPMGRNMYLLCSSAFTSADYAKFGLYKGKCFKWGYFPVTRVYGDIDALIKKKQLNSILWVGRFIDWKHPEIPIELARRLKMDGYNFHLSIIGNGIMENQLRDRIIKYGLNDCISMLGAMDPSEVRDYMERTQIYLFTSDRQEGWGAVLNEAMNSCCAVLANEMIGAVPYLIKNNENGLIYQNGNIDDLYSKVIFLLKNKMYSDWIGKNANESICTEWCAEIAAERLIKISSSLLYGGRGFRNFYRSGPCSNAD